MHIQPIPMEGCEFSKAVLNSSVRKLKEGRHGEQQKHHYSLIIQLPTQGPQESLTLELQFSKVAEYKTTIQTAICFQ